MTTQSSMPKQSVEQGGENKAKVRKVNSKDDFNTELSVAGGKLVVVDFYADWCGPCKMIAPKIAAMAAEFEKVVFLKVNVDEVEDLASEQGIQAMPTFKLFKNGKKVDELTGANDGKIRELIEKYK